MELFIFARFHVREGNEDEAAFEIHSALARTVEFIKRMETLLDHPFEATRARLLM